LALSSGYLGNTCTRWFLIFLPVSYHVSFELSSIRCLCGNGRRFRLFHCLYGSCLCSENRCLLRSSSVFMAASRLLVFLKP
jgi:hypothetical protein